MINVLPYAERARVRREYRLRLVAVALFFLAAALFAAALLLIPSYLLARSKEAAAAERLAGIERVLALRDADALEADLLATTAHLGALLDEPPRGIRETFEAISTERSADVSLQSFTFQRGRDGAREFNVSGRAGSRESLLGFAKRLEGKGLFRSVDLPISNFTKQTDIDFSLRLTALSQTP